VTVGTGLGDHVGVAGRSVTDLGGHHSRISLYFLDRIHVEVGKGGAPQFRIGRVEPVHRKHGCRTALSIDGKLLREVRRAVCVRHGAGCQQEQLAEIAGV